jgi:hypothetical protein
VKLLSDAVTLSVKTGKSFPEFTRGGLAVSHPEIEVPGFTDYYLNLVPGVNSDSPWIASLWERTYNCTLDNTESLCSAYPSPKTAYGNLNVATNYYIGMHVYGQSLHAVIEERCSLAFQNISHLESCIDGRDLLKTLKKKQYSVGDERISFDDNGDRAGQYTLLHYSLEFHVEPVLFWDQLEHTMDFDLELIKWSFFRENGVAGTNVEVHSQNVSLFVPDSVCSLPCDLKEYKIQKSPSCCWECRACRQNEILTDNKTSCKECPPFFWPNQASLESCEPIPYDYLRWTETTAEGLLVVNLVGIVTSISFLIIFIHKRKARLLKASNRRLSFMMLVGTLVATMMAFAFLAKPSLVICYIRDIGFHFTFTLLFAPLLVKTSAIFFIFTSGLKGRRQPEFVSSKGQNISLVLIFATQVSIFIRQR